MARAQQRWQPAPEAVGLLRASAHGHAGGMPGRFVARDYIIRAAISARWHAAHGS